MTRTTQAVMGMIKAFRKEFPYQNPERYRLFLKSQFLSREPRYYSVAYYRLVQTPDGPMYAMKLTAGIENPDLEPIAECWINNEYVYLWRDHCWTVAVDKKNKRIMELEGLDVRGDSSLYDTSIIPAPCNKTLVIHKVGTDTIE